MKNIRRNAYNSLTGKWGVGITACLIYSLISTNGLKLIDNFVTRLFSILSRFIDKNPYESWKDSITQVLKALPFYDWIRPTLLIASIIFLMLAAPLNMGICRGYRACGWYAVCHPWQRAYHGGNSLVRGCFCRRTRYKNALKGDLYEPIKTNKACSV